MSDDAPPPETGETKAEGSPWGKVFWLFVILIASGLIVFLSFIWLGDRGMTKGADLVREIFNPKEVVSNFHEWRELQVKGTDGNILEVATAQATEKFTRTTNIEWFGKIMPLGTTVSEITIPATYRFHIDLNGEWFVQSDGNRLLVMAPKLRPSLPVAFHTGGMQKKTKSGWGRWDGDDNLAELEQSITTKLNARAGDEKTLAKAREKSRLAVAKFLKQWLLTQDVWQNGKFESITVVFEDEEDVSLMNAPPTMQLEVPKTLEPEPAL